MNFLLFLKLVGLTILSWELHGAVADEETNLRGKAASRELNAAGGTFITGCYTVAATLENIAQVQGLMANADCNQHCASNGYQFSIVTPFSERSGTAIYPPSKNLCWCSMRSLKKTPGELAKDPTVDSTCHIITQVNPSAQASYSGPVAAMGSGACFTYIDGMWNARGSRSPDYHTYDDYTCGEGCFEIGA